MRQLIRQSGSFGQLKLISGLSRTIFHKFLGHCLCRDAYAHTGKIPSLITLSLNVSPPSFPMDACFPMGAHLSLDVRLLVQNEIQ